MLFTVSLFGMDFNLFNGVITRNKFDVVNEDSLDLKKEIKKSSIFIKECVICPLYPQEGYQFIGPKSRNKVNRRVL